MTQNKLDLVKAIQALIDIIEEPDCQGYESEYMRDIALDALIYIKGEKFCEKWVGSEGDTK